MIWIGLLALLVLLLALPIIAESRRKPMDENARRDAPGKFYELTDGTTHVRTEGPVRGPVLVCVHGLTTSEYVWDDIAADMAQTGYRVVTYDLYGRGYSDRPPSPQTEAFFLRQLEELVRKLELPDSFILMGYSMGAAISVAYAAKHPERVDNLILVAPAGLSDAQPGMDRKLRDWPVLGDWIIKTMGGWLRRRRAAATPEADPKRAAFTQRQLAESDYRGFLGSVLSSARNMLKTDQTDLHRKLANERVPTLAIWGEEDSVIPLSALGRMTQANRYVFHDTVAGADHGLPYTHPEAVVKVTKDFLL